MYTATCKKCQPIVTTSSEDYTEIVEFIAAHKREENKDEHDFILTVSGPKANQMVEGLGFTPDKEK